MSMYIVMKNRMAFDYNDIIFTFRTIKEAEGVVRCDTKEGGKAKIYKLTPVKGRKG